MEEDKSEIIFMRLLYLLGSRQEKRNLFYNILASIIFHSGDKKAT